MHNSENPIEVRYHQVVEHIRAGDLKAARQILSEILSSDNNNLTAWELMVRATNDQDEKSYCLKQILCLNPNHPWAKKQLALINATNSSNPTSAPPLVEATKAAPGKASPRRKKPAAWLPFVLIPLVLICIGAAGTSLDRAGIFALLFPPHVTQTTNPAPVSACQSLIQRAMQIAQKYCDRVGANQVCYGNTTLRAELVPNITRHFSMRGDIIDTAFLLRLSASPLDLDGNQWGIAIFKVLANLPNSLPGQLVTMIVFGNTTLDKTSGNLESFYFSSDFGQISCEKVPFDGILVDMPDGAGLRFKVNDTEMILMGNASLKAAKDRDMTVSLFSGSGQVQAAGETKYVGAGQQVSIPMGGDNGVEASGPPSAPAALSTEALFLACNLTGQVCSSGEITPVSPDQTQASLQSEAAVTVPSKPAASSAAPAAVTHTPLFAQTYTSIVLSTWTPSPTITSTFHPTSTRPPVSQGGSTPTTSRPATSTSRPIGPAPSATPRLPATNTSIVPPGATNTATYAPPTPRHTQTNTQAAPQPTATKVPTPACEVTLGSLVPNGTDLSIDITNNNAVASGILTINHLEVWWVNNPASQVLSKITLGGNKIWSGTDNVPTTRLPEEFPWQGPASSRQIPAGETVTLHVQFGVSPQDLSVPAHPRVHLTFYAGCDVDRSYP